MGQLAAMDQDKMTHLIIIAIQASSQTTFCNTWMVSIAQDQVLQLNMKLEMRLGLG